MRIRRLVKAYDDKLFVELINCRVEEVIPGDIFRYIDCNLAYEVIGYDEDHIKLKYTDKDNPFKLEIDFFLREINSMYGKIEYISYSDRKKDDGRELIELFRKVKSIHDEYMKMLEKYSKIGKDIMIESDVPGFDYDVYTIDNINGALKVYKNLVSGNIREIIDKAEKYDKIKESLK